GARLVRVVVGPRAVAVLPVLEEPHAVADGPEHFLTRDRRDGRPSRHQRGDEQRRDDEDPTSAGHGEAISRRAGRRDRPFTSVLAALFPWRARSSYHGMADSSRVSWG